MDEEVVLSLFGKAPETIPDDLTISEYRELGHWFLEEEKYEMARQAFTRAIAMDENDAIAINCKRLLASRVPRHSIPDAVIVGFKRAQMQGLIKPHIGKKSALKLKENHPEFEWAYQFLAECLLQDGDVEGSLQALDAALRINPDYEPAIALKARALVLDMEYQEARIYLNKILAMDPDDNAMRALRLNLEFLIGIEQQEVAIP